MKTLIIDIETAPLPHAVDIINYLYPFDPDKVALGNASKPDTVAKKIEEAREEHLPKLLEKAQLDPALSFIAAVGIRKGDEDTIIIPGDKDGDDTAVLSEIHHIIGSMKEYCQIAGWNVQGFDLTYIIKRMWMNRIPTPRILGNRGFNSNMVVDLMRHYNLYEYGKFASLELAAKTLGVKSPGRDKCQEVTGKDFWKFYFSGDPAQVAKAEIYLTADVDECAEIAKIIL